MKLSVGRGSWLIPASCVMDRTDVCWAGTWLIPAAADHCRKNCSQKMHFFKLIKFGYDDDNDIAETGPSLPSAIY